MFIIVVFVPNKELSEFQLDALREVGNMGAGHAAVALTQVLNRSTYMSIPNVALDRVKSIYKLVKMPTDQDLAIISLNTVSDLKYSLLIFFDKESVLKIIAFTCHFATSSCLANSRASLI